VVPELVQQDASAEAIAREARRILDDDAERARMVRDFAEIRTILARPGAADAAAELALELLQ
jgi:lipid A disaccharide synthetase